MRIRRTVLGDHVPIVDASAGAKTPITRRQRANLRSALRMWATVPEENVLADLARWRGWPRAGEPERFERPDCGTRACFGGWCAWWPEFRAQGVKTDSDGMPIIPHRDAGLSSVSTHLFGVSWLFFSRTADSLFDRWIIHEFQKLRGRRITDHELVELRLRLALHLTVPNGSVRSRGVLRGKATTVHELLLLAT